MTPSPSPTSPGFRSETIVEYDQDFFFGISFLILAVFSSLRIKIYFDPSGGGRVITLFYILIFISASTRALWFLIPSSFLEESYAPTEAVIAWKSHGWVGVLMSELLVATGSLSLYAAFILVTCYWSHMLMKVNVESLETQQPVLPQAKSVGAIEIFLRFLIGFTCFQIINMLLFILQIMNSEEMILIDSIMLTVVGIMSTIYMTLYSHRIRAVLLIIGTLNSSIATTRPQINRILALTRVGNAFFICRIAIESSFMISCIILMKGKLSINSFVPYQYIMLVS